MMMWLVWFWLSLCFAGIRRSFVECRRVDFEIAISDLL